MKDKVNPFIKELFVLIPPTKHRIIWLISHSSIE